MSQIYVPATSSMPAIPTSFATNIGGPAVPVANVLQLIGANQTPFSDSNYTDLGIVTSGSGNTVSYYITNRDSVQISTSDATKTTAITFPLSSTTAGVYFFWGNVQAFNTTTPAGATYSFSGGFRTDTTSATEIGTEFADVFEEASMTSLNFFVEASSNNVVISVKGLAGQTINWNILLEYRRVQ